MAQPSGSDPDPRPGHRAGEPGEPDPGTHERPGGRRGSQEIVSRFVAISGGDMALTSGPILLVCVAALYLAVRLVQPAPPDTLTIAAGPKGSTFWNSAQRYKTILARN